NSFLVEIARGEDLNVAPASAVQLRADPAAVGNKIAAVEPDARRLAAPRNDFAKGRANVVCVKKQSSLLRENIEETIEGLRFVLVSHDPGMGLRAVSGDVKKPARHHVGGALASGDPCCARGKNSGFASMGAASAELDDGFAFCGDVQASGATCDHSLKIDSGQKARFQNLAFDDRGRNAKKRFARENQGAFTDGPHVSGKTETRKIVEEFAANMAKNGETPQVFDFRRSKTDSFHELERLLKTSGDQEIALRRKIADEQLECGASVEARLKIASRHGEFVQIGKKAGMLVRSRRFHEGYSRGKAIGRPWTVPEKKQRGPQRPSLAESQESPGSRRETVNDCALLECCVLERLGGAKANNSLGLNLNCFTGSGVAAHAGFAMRLDRASDSWNDEFS